MYIGVYVNIYIYIYTYDIYVCIYEQPHLSTLMKRGCGIKQGLRNRWFHLHNEIKTRWGGLKKRDRF